MFSARFLTTQATHSAKNRNLLLIGIPSVLAAGGLFYYSSKSAASLTSVNALNPDEWKDFQLQQINNINHNTKSFRFQLPKGTTQLGLETASCFVTRFQDGTKADGSPSYVIRPYTPIEDPADGYTGYFDLIVKKYPTGKMSGHIHDLKVGDSLSIKGPIKKFPYVPNEFKEIGMVAGGTGIAPMLQVIQRIISNPSDKTKMSLVFANVEEQDILLKSYLDKVQKSNPDQIKIHYVLDKPPKNWEGDSGFVNEKMLKSYMPPPSKDSKIFVCGPPPMMKHVSGDKAKDYSQGEIGGLLKGLGYTENEVYKF